MRQSIAPDRFTLPEPPNIGLNSLFVLNAWLLLSAPVIAILAVIYHRFFKKRPLQLSRDTLCISILLGGVLLLNGLSISVLIGIVGAVD